jgi:2-polyprenyl-6-methoxyphenol hydroxylase-like FAD-dependent oxidoreductase
VRTVVIGGSSAGLLTALLLARAGHDVVVVERDGLELAPDVDAAARRAFRRGAPQLVQPHLVMARCRELLQQRLPDVYESLLGAGVEEAPLESLMPPTLMDRSARPGDEQLTTLVSRRSTIDWAVLRVVRHQPGVSIRAGVDVTGLIARPGDPPLVTGVRTSQGDIDCDIVIDASGRRSVGGSWLRHIVARPPVISSAECGLAYYSRHYQIRRGAALPEQARARHLTALDVMSVGLWGGDHGSVQIAVVPLAADRRYRDLRDPTRFARMLGAVSPYDEWLTAFEPISDVYAMGGLHNTLRRLVDQDGPIVLGLHQVGDVVCTTNPTMSRGLTIAIWGAVALADIIADHPRDPLAQALALDDHIGRDVQPLYDDQAAVDGTRLAALRHTVFGEPLPEPTPTNASRVSYVELRAAAQTDPAAFRAFWQVQALTRRPQDVYTDPVVVADVRAALQPHQRMAAQAHQRT